MRKNLIGMAITAAGLVLLAAVYIGISYIPPFGPGRHVVLEADLDAEHEADAAVRRHALMRFLHQHHIEVDQIPDNDTVRLAPGARGRALLQAFATEQQEDLSISENMPGMFHFAPTSAALARQDADLLDRTGKIVVRRLGPLSNYYVYVKRIGANRLAVDLWGRPDPKAIATLLAPAGRLSFNLVDEDGERRLPPDGPVPVGDRRLDFADHPPILVVERVLIDGDHIADARQSFDRNGASVVDIRFDDEGRRLFATATAANVGRRIAVVLDDKVLTAPVINEPVLGGSVIIAGAFTPEQASKLAELIHGGGLPVALRIVENKEGNE